MDIAGFHQLRFYPTEVPVNIDSNYLDATTRRLFGMSLSSFTNLSNVTVNKRKYRQGYSFENKIILLVGDYTKRYPLTIEINGGAFDHACINVDKISRIIEQEYIVSAIHAKIDTTETKFKQLFQAYQLESVTASSLLRSDRQSTSKTLYFGANPQYSIYEAGLYHPELSNKYLTRHELKCTGDQARQFFKEWRRDPDNLASLIKSYIAGHFKVVFRDHTSSDTNISRRPPLPIWEKWLATAAPRHFDRVTPTKPQLANQVKTWKTKLLNLQIDLGEDAYQDIITGADELYQHRNDPEPQEVQLEFTF